MEQNLLRVRLQTEFEVRTEEKRKLQETIDALENFRVVAEVAGFEDLAAAALEKQMFLKVRVARAVAQYERFLKLISRK